MTDGIITQSYYAISSMIDRNAKLTKSDADMFLILYHDRLIEEIKKYNFDSDKYFDDTIKQALIGDNTQ